MSEPFEQDDMAGDTVVSTMTQPRSKTDSSTKTKKLPPYNVIILNDEEHTFEYVIDMLMKVFTHPFPKAEELTWRIHNSGRAIVLTTHKERAELKRDQVLSWGPDPRMSVSKGPLQCYIEPAEAGEE
jgi:ATP-dependent Clp protease adaptor protein ClpS